MAKTSAAVRNRWNKENYYRINVTVPKGNLAMIKEYAEKQGMTVNSLVNRLLKQELNMSDREWGLASEQVDDDMMKGDG